MNQFPANAIPGFQPPPGMVPGMMHPSMIQQLPPGMAPPPGMGPPPGVVPGGPPGGPGGAPPEMLQQQYLHQQQLAMAQAMRQQQLQQQQHAVSVAAANAQAQAAQAPPRPKARKGRPPVLPRGQQGDYVKGAMAPPTVPAVRQTEVGNAATGHETEPWADMLDELDPRELAMARFRARQEVMTEIFGPERVQDVPEPVTDPWSGIGITGETLEAKVDALEKSNAELEANFDAELEEWRKRLENPELIEPESV